MDFSLDIPLKVEETDGDCDSNGNIRVTFDMEIKIEKDAVATDVDWCVSSFESGDLLDPLFFKHVTDPVGIQCGLCYRYFPDSYAIWKHNLTHLQVEIVNPVLYKCPYCAYYSTNKLLMECHVVGHNQHMTNTLSKETKMYTPGTKASYKNVLKIFKSDNRGPKKSKNCMKTYKDEPSKFIDGMTNWLSYRPKSSKAFKSENSAKTYKDRVPKLRDGMTDWLPYRPKSSKALNSVNTIKTNQDTMPTLDGITDFLSYKPKSTKPTLNDSNKTHTCNICHKAYTYKHWHAHMQDVHNSGSYTCEICGLTFKCERYLKKHLMKKHVGNKAPGAMKIDVQCEQCDAVLNSLNALTTHLRNVHSAKKHVCYICKSTLKCKSYLLAHMRRLHCIDGEKHECECGKSFKSKRYLMVHKRNAHLKKKKVDKDEDVMVD